MLLEERLITKDQMLFFLIAMAVFAVVIMVLYRQDKKRDKEYFKGTWMIFAALIVIVSVLFLFVISQK
jgi:cytochrome bd-type quinol oxidase subunit 2